MEGIWERGSREGIDHIEEKLKECLNNSVLWKNLQSSIDKALYVFDIILAGSCVYSKANLTYFSETFYTMEILPVSKEIGIKQDDFIKCCLKDLKKIRKQKFFNIASVDTEDLCQKCRTFFLQDIKVVEKCLEESKQKFCQSIQEQTAEPYCLSKLLQRKNAIFSITLLCLGTEIQKDESLVQLFFITQPQALEYYIEQNIACIEQAKDNRNREQFRIYSEYKQNLLKVQDEINFGIECIPHDILEFFSNSFQEDHLYFHETIEHFDILHPLAQEKIQELTKTADEQELQELKKQIQTLDSEIQEFKERHGMQVKMNLSIYLSIHHSEIPTIHNLYSQFQYLQGLVEIEYLLETQFHIASLISSIGKIKEAEELWQELLNEPLDDEKKALIYFNRFVNFMVGNLLDEAYQSYMQSLEWSKSAYQLFETRKYRPQQILGVGGFGIVFLCMSKVWGPVVVKALHRPDSNINTIIENAQSLAKSNSPYIIGLKDYGYLDWDNQKGPFIVMDYFSGKNLRDYVDQKGPVPIFESLEISIAIAQGLSDAHKNGVIHRDLKPANVLYRKDDEGFELKIIDFDLALHGLELRDMASSYRVTGESSVLSQSITGTLQYAPPEQMGELIDGKVWEVSQYSDIFAFGRTLKYLLFGTLDPHPRSMRNFENETLLDLIGDCESKNPNKRPQSFEEVLEILQKTKEEYLNVMKLGHTKRLEQSYFANVTQSMLQANIDITEQDIIFFPEFCTGLTLQDVVENLQNEYSINIDNLDEIFDLQYDFHDKYPKGIIVKVLQKGSLQHNLILTKATLLISQGQNIEQEQSIIEYPKNLEEPLQELINFDITEDNLGNFFNIQRDYHKTIPEGEIIELISPGIIRNNIIEKKATILVSLGTQQDIYYPSSIGITLEQAKDEIRDKVKSIYMLDYAFQIHREEFNDDYEVNTISELLTQGIIRDSTVYQPAVVIISKGSPPLPESITGFQFIGKNRYSCGEQTYIVKEYLHTETDMEFILISGGQFLMGSPETEQEREKNEQLRMVEVSPYLIAKYPCTQEQWERIMGVNPSHFQDARRPVEWISWEDCQEFCKRTNLNLPTEAQWEYACRGKNESAYCFGNDSTQLRQYAWYSENSQDKTHPVGQKKSNAFGLHDMHGNVWEFCQDSCNLKQSLVITEQHEKNALDPVSKQGDFKVVRGGAWYFSQGYCRSATRYPIEPTDRLFCVGVRFAKKITS